MTRSEHWMMRLKNRCGNYVKQRTRAGAVECGCIQHVPAPTIHDRNIPSVRKGNGQSRRSMVGVTLAVALPFLFAFLLPMPLAHAAANGRIYGQLLDGTKKNAPVVGQ